MQVCTGQGQAALVKGVLLLLTFLATSYVLNLEVLFPGARIHQHLKDNCPWQYLYSFGKIFHSTDSFYPLNRYVLIATHLASLTAIAKCNEG
jgi:hypothetical protein